MIIVVKIRFVVIFSKEFVKLKINNWCVTAQADAYTPPEGIRECLGGEVVNHPKYPNQVKSLLTSAIVGYEDGCIKVASGHLYELGTVDPDYEKAYPNAYQRLIDGAKKRTNIV